MPTLLPMFLRNFTNKFPKVHLKIEELNTDDLIQKLDEGHLDAGIAATPLLQENIKERVLYYEPFVGYIPQQHRLASTSRITIGDLDIDDILLLEDGHCFRDGVINLCKSAKTNLDDRFQIESGSFETLIKLSEEGMGMTLLPYLHTLDLGEKQKANLHHFNDPAPAREVSLIYPKSELKIQIIDAMFDVISGVVRGAIAYQDVQIISPLPNKK
jgi:LysR family hydrogen peroxide-inducible transcriptional activator